MLMLEEDMAKLRGEVKRLEDSDFTPEDIIKRLEQVGIPQDVIDQLVKLPKAMSRSPLIEDKPDLLELCDSLAIFLDDGLPKLFNYHSLSQLETLNTLKSFHIRLKEAVNENRG